MCGIAGMLALENPGAIDPAAVLRMCDAQAHRGPDDSGLWTSDDGRTVLGHRRLSIIDLSPTGHQPMHTVDGRLHVVYNGEIYNFPALRAELEELGHAFQSTSDTEVLLLGYREWGLGLLDRLGGMFAFALHDSERDETLLARDPLGIKPLYYGTAGGRFAFASEVQAIRGELDSGGTDPEALAHYLMWGSIAAPRTLYRNFRALSPGHWLRVRAGRVEPPGCYFRLEDEIGKPDPMDAAEAAERARAALLDSVRRHMIADVEVGAFLSGGVDSSALVGLLAEVHDGPLTTVNLSFDTPEYDEGPLALEAAELYGSNHHSVTLDLTDARERISGAVKGLDQPSIDGTNVYFVSEAATRAGLKVAVSGVGGDELFAGYATFTQMRQIMGTHRRIGALPGLGGLRGPAASLLRAFVGRHDFLKYAMALDHGGTWPGAYFAQRGLISPHQVRRMLAPSVRDAVDACMPEHELDARIGSADVPEEERISLYEIKQYLQMQLLRDADAMSMRHSLEVRTPLVDRQLVTALFRIPAEHRHAGPAKRLLREAPRPAVPNRLWQRKKQGFALPIEDWIRSRELPLRLPEHPMLDPQAIRSVEREFEAGRIMWSRLWPLLVLESYLD